MLVLAVAGLLVPGYALARALRSPLAWASAFPLSALLIAETAITAACCGIPLTFFRTLTVLALISGASWAIAFRRRPASTPQTDNYPLSGTWSRTLAIIVGLQVGLLLSGLALRTTLHPLSGFDAIFRWEGLARVMLEDEGLAHYPPVSAEDFDHYTYPEGIPPLVASVYWWIYASYGAPCPAATSIAVVLQFVSCYGLVYGAARQFYGTIGGLVALATIASSAVFFEGLSIGQEAGYTALSVAGQLAMVLTAIRTPRAGTVVAAGLFAALGALSRDYGPALAACGLLGLGWQRETRRYVLLFCAVTMILGAPWYVRNWARTGNPFYSVDVGLGFPVNHVHSAIMATYSQMYGARLLQLITWVFVTLRGSFGATLAILIGLPGLRLWGSKGAILTFAALLTGLLWCWSLPYTSGDIDYSMRVMTPVWVTLAIAAGGCGPTLLARTGRSATLARATVLVLFLLCGGFTSASSWAHPYGVERLPGVILNRRLYPDEQLNHLKTMIDALDRSGLPPARVLTDDAFFAMGLRSSQKYHPVMAWSPEVEFLADKEMTPADAVSKLCALRIGMVVLVLPGHKDYWMQYRAFREGAPTWPILRETIRLQPIFLLPCDVLGDNSPHQSTSDLR